MSTFRAFLTIRVHVVLQKILELESQKKQFAAGVAAGETNEQNQAFYQEMTDHMERLMSHLTM